MRYLWIGALLVMFAATAWAADPHQKFVPQKPQLQVNKPIAVHGYEARLTRPMAGQRQVKTANLVWKCAGSECQAQGGAPTPSQADCQSLAKQVGGLLYCGAKGGYKGADKPPQINPNIKPQVSPQPAKPGFSPQKPQFQKPTPPPSGNNNAGQAPPSGTPPESVVRTPLFVTTRGLEIIGSPNPPVAPGEFKPMTVTTSPMEVIGNPELPSGETEPFSPITVTTPPLEVIGTPIR